MSRLVAFVRENNRIEGILREPTKDEIAVHNALLSKAELVVNDVEDFVAIVAPGHKLRRHHGLDVHVGSHIAPPGGLDILVKLTEILASTQIDDPYDIHQRYEYLHPFTDGNGRSGRAIWLWMMNKRGKRDSALALGFLHSWYYDTLARYQSIDTR